MSKKFITRSVLARRVKLSRARITQLIAEGVIQTVDSQRKLLDTKEAVASVNSRIDKRIQSKHIQLEVMLDEEMPLFSGDEGAESMDKQLSFF